MEGSLSVVIRVPQALPMMGRSKSLESASRRLCMQHPAEASARMLKVERLWMRESINPCPGLQPCPRRQDAGARLALEVPRVLCLTSSGSNPKGPEERKPSLAQLLHTYNSHTPSHCPLETAFQKQTF